MSVSIRTFSATNWFKQEECVDWPVKSGNRSKFDWDLGGCFMTSPGIGALLSNHSLFRPALLTAMQWQKLLQDSSSSFFLLLLLLLLDRSLYIAPAVLALTV